MESRTAGQQGKQESIGKKAKHECGLLWTPALLWFLGSCGTQSWYPLLGLLEKLVFCFHGIECWLPGWGICGTRYNHSICMCQEEHPQKGHFFYLLTKSRSLHPPTTSPGSNWRCYLGNHVREGLFSCHCHSRPTAVGREIMTDSWPHLSSMASTSASLGNLPGRVVQVHILRTLSLGSPCPYQSVVVVLAQLQLQLAMEMPRDPGNTWVQNIFAFLLLCSSSLTSSLCLLLFWHEEFKVTMQ
jgi:hypothetical protein